MESTLIGLLNHMRPHFSFYLNCGLQNLFQRPNISEALEACTDKLLQPVYIREGIQEERIYL